MRKIASYEPSCVKIHLVVFPVEDGKNKKGKGRQKSQASVIFHLFVGKPPPVNGFFTDFAHQEICRMSNVIMCANFGSEKLRDLGYTGGKIFGSLIEMAGHSYNRAALPRSL